MPAPAPRRISAVLSRDAPRTGLALALDYLFVFMPAERRMDLSPRVAADVERLRRRALAP